MGFIQQPVKLSGSPSDPVSFWWWLAFPSGRIWCTDSKGSCEWNFICSFFTLYLRCFLINNLLFLQRMCNRLLIKSAHVATHSKWNNDKFQWWMNFLEECLWLFMEVLGMRYPRFSTPHVWTKVLESYCPISPSMKCTDYSSYQFHSNVCKTSQGARTSNICNHDWG